MASKSVPRDDVVVARESRSHRWSWTVGGYFEELKEVRFLSWSAGVVFGG